VALIGTGGWQYLKGLLAAETPIYMGTVYRIHYFAASLLIFATVAFITDWWLRGEQALTPGKGQSIRTLRGLAHELPKPLGTLLAYDSASICAGRLRPPSSYVLRTVDLVPLVGALDWPGYADWHHQAVRYIYPIPGDVLYWVSAVHVGAGVLLSLKVLDHLRYVLAPSRWPLMATMASGWVPAGFVKRFHPGWYARIESESPAPVVAATSQTQVVAS